MARKHLRGGTWNARRDRSATKVRKSLRRIMRRHRLDFLLLQEFADYAGHLRRHPIPGYRLVMPEHGHAERQNPILVREDVRVRWPRVKAMAASGWITVDGHEHAAPHSVVALLDGWLRVASIHAPVTVSWPYGKPTGPEARVASYLSHTRRCVRFARAGQRAAARRTAAGRPAKATLLGGDWNARTWERGNGTPVHLAKRARLTITEPANRKGPGHDGIDYVLSDARVSHMRKHGTHGSDHPLVTFRVHRPA